MKEDMPLLSPMTLGTAQIGGNYGIANKTGQPDVAESYDILETAWDGGVACYDTARWYGDSENILGRFFASRRVPAVLITKVYLPVDVKREAVRQEIRKQTLESLGRLQINKLPILLLHGVLLPESCWPEVLKGFRECYREGLVAGFGLSCGADSESMRKLIRFSDDPIIRYVQLPVNLADQRPLLLETLAYMESRRIRVFARSIYMQGLLLLPEEEIPGDLQEIVPLIRGLRSHSEETGRSLPQMLTSYVRDMRGIHSLVIGAETADQVKSNVTFLKGPAWDPSDRQKITDLAGSLPEHVLNPAVWKRQGVFRNEETEHLI